MEFRQPVDGLAEELGMWVLEAVPARVVGRVSKPEVGTLVDDRGAAREESWRQVRGGPVGERQEDGIDRRQLVGRRRRGCRSFARLLRHYGI